MPSAIADASVLIHLSNVEKLDLLRVFYDSVLVPAAVWREVVEEGGGRPGVDELRDAREEGWVEVRDPGAADLVRLLREGLGPGESEAIALAVSHSNHTLLVDEKDARRKASVYDLPKTGTVGLLIRACAEEQLDGLEQTLRNLREDGGFWISDELIERALQGLGDPGGEA